MIISTDKLLHCLACSNIVFITEPFVGYWSILIASVIAFGKEFIDHKRYGVFSWGDILWDYVGITIAVLINIFTKFVVL